MQITGTFNNYKNDKSYTVTIYRVGQGVTEEPIIIEKDGIADYDRTENLIFFATDPVTLSCDYSDTFSHVIVKSASVRLVSNFNLKDLVCSSNNRDIKLIITQDQETIFSGFIEPLTFNEPYAHNWEQIEITATDDLATSQYIKYPNLILTELNQMGIFSDLIDNIASALDLTVEYDGLDTDIYNALSNTKISNSLWVGESPDDWMSCYDVLEQVGKYWGIWFVEYGNKLRCFNWHNETRTTVDLDKDDFTDASTNLSNADAYTQIKLTCNIENAESIVEFGDDIVSPYTHYAKYLEELVTEGDGSRALKLFTNLVKNNVTADETDKKHPSESYIYKNFCWVKDSDLWDFGYSGYQNEMYGQTNYEKRKNKTLKIKDATPIKTQQYILNWLNTNSGRGAFVSFGRTDKTTLKDTSPINSIDLKDSLIISINGHDSKSHVSSLMSQWSDSNPICSFIGASKQFTPPDSDTINYLVINGNILLNKLYAKTGKVMHRKNKDKETFGEEYDGMNESLYIDSQNTYSQIVTDFADSKLVKGVNPDYMNQSVPKIGENDWGCYYTHRFYNGNAGSEEINTSFNLTHGDLKQSKYNETWKYQYSVDSNGVAKKIDNTSKIPILKCQLKIGDKYCIERADLGPDHFDEFVWMTEEDAQTNQNTNNPWLYFTIGIDPKIDDFIIGKEYDIKNNIWYYDDLDGNKGTAIPIKFEDNLNGTVEFKIIGPMNIWWRVVNDDNKYIYYFLNNNLPENLNFYYPILEKLSSIILSNFKIEITSNKGRIQNNTANNDLVYASDENDTYIEPHNDDIKIATMITSKEAAEWGTEMVISISHVANLNGSGYLGFEYGVTDEHGDAVIDPETGEQEIAYIKPEQLYVNDYYNEYSEARTVVNTQIKLDANYITKPDKYSFNFGQYLDGLYVPIAYEANLKYDTITLTNKYMDNEPDEQQSN